MRSVNVAELKNKLSAYLTFAKAGEEIIIRERNRPVAKLSPFVAGDASANSSSLASPAPNWISFATGRFRSRMMISSPALAKVRYALSLFFNSATLTLRIDASRGYYSHILHSQLLIYLQALNLRRQIVLR